MPVLTERRTATYRERSRLAKMLGKRLKAERARTGMSQVELSRTAGYRRELCYRIEAGRRLPSVEILCKLAAVLHIEPGDLVPDPEEWLDPLSEALEDKWRRELETELSFLNRSDKEIVLKVAASLAAGKTPFTDYIRIE